MPTYTIEMLWTCSTCSHRDNRGLSDRVCVKCGKPKDDRDEERMPGDTSEANAIREPENVSRAAAGPDWTCLYCKSLQNRIDRVCGRCGVDQVKGTKPSVSLDDKGNVLASVSSLPTMAAPSVRLPASRMTRRRRLLMHPGIMATLVALFVACMLYLAFRTKIVDATVTTLAWEHKTKIERYQVWRRDGWTPDNLAFDRKNEGSRIHHYDHVRIGSHQESYPDQEACGQTCTPVPRTCRTTSRVCTSNKNGSATCTGGDTICTGGGQSCSTKYCPVTRYRTIDDYEDQARYQTWWSWSVWDWGYNRTVLRAGGVDQPTWPLPRDLEPPTKLASGESERSFREASYHVSFFASDKKTYAITPESIDLFQTFHVGDRRRLKVGLAHGVEVLPKEHR